MRFGDRSPAYVLPAPGLILKTLSHRLGAARAIAVGHARHDARRVFARGRLGGVGLAVLFDQSRLVEYSLYPYAVILQVTPIGRASRRFS